MREDPYLSVVVTTRNDDHGGDPLQRLQSFVNCFDAQCRRAGLDAEVIVVEWNPTSDRPKVSSLVRLPARSSCSYRFVEVPPALHHTLRYADVLPLFQMIAKNVGIRRARGRFILATNIDVIFSTELVEYLASGRLEQGRLYRLDRHDIESGFPVDGRLEDQMEYCRTHQLRLHTRSGTHPVNSTGQIGLLAEDVVASEGVVLGDGWHTREGESAGGFFRWAKGEARLSVDRALGSHLARGAVLDIEVEPNPYQPDSWVDLEIVGDDHRLGRRRVSQRTRMRFNLPDDIERHELAVRVLDSSGGRESLPLFESREQLCYRVYHVSVHGVPGHEYDLALWRRVPKDNAKLRVKHTPTGIEVATDPGKYSYCTQYGPFESPADGRYEFLLEYEPIAGSLAFGAMDDVRRCWLPAASMDVELDTIRAVAISVEVPRGTTFSLFVSNNRPDGESSRFILRRLLGSVASEQLRCGSFAAWRMRASRVVGRLATAWQAPRVRIKSAVSSIERERARRFQSTLEEKSERVRELEARVTSMNPLADLAPFVRLLRQHRPAELHQNASGDFQLMAREHWHALRGYPELEMFSMSIDGVLEAIACAAGIGEEIFEMPLCAYHLEHEKGSGWTPEGEAQLKKRIAESGIAWLDAGTVHIWTTYMQWLRRPMIFNGADWGMGASVLPEKTCQPVADNA